MQNNDTGILLNAKNIKLHRTYFEQMAKLLGINVEYFAPVNDTVDYNTYGELFANYEPPKQISCIYDEHPTQKTMKMLGWNAELADASVVIHVPYDLKKLQVGAIFKLPAGLDKANDRIYRVLRISNIAIYPASVACELGPLIQDTLEQQAVEHFDDSNFNLLDGEEERYGH